MTELNKIINADVIDGLKSLEDNSIDCIITSPPYYQLRDYGFSEQWGLEKTYQEYLDKMISFMAECKRVIKSTGSIWINLGDTYGTISGNMKQGNVNENKIKYSGNIENYTKPENMEKCLMLIPHRFAIRCIDELGLILRNDIIWAKPNGMPESVTDRFSKKHEFFFFFVKSKRYYFNLDGVRSKHKQISIDRALRGVSDSNKWFTDNGKSMNQKLVQPRKNKTHTKNYGEVMIGGQVRDNHDIHDSFNPSGKNPGDVADFWDITTKGSSEKHYATFNSHLSAL